MRVGKSAGNVSGIRLQSLATAAAEHVRNASNPNVATAQFLQAFGAALQAPAAAPTSRATMPVPPRPSRTATR